ncbi:hypothetical protein ACWET9_32310 [Streptomyces sp. NPDC004059]
MTDRTDYAQALDAVADRISPENLAILARGPIPEQCGPDGCALPVAHQYGCKHAQRESTVNEADAS